MSADCNVKLTLSPLSTVLAKKPSASITPPRAKRVCGFCELPLGEQPPVLLKAGCSVHLECYLLVRKKSANKQFNENVR